MKDNGKVTMKANKKKLSTDCSVEVSCCRKISVFACACAVLSLIVHTYNYVESGVDEEARLLVKNILDEKLEERIEAYLAEISGTTPRRAKREAMLVNMCFSFFFALNVDVLFLLLCNYTNHV